MRKRDWDLLFSKSDLRSVLDAQLQSLSDRVLKVDPSRFETESDEMLSASIASELVVSPLELEEEEISVSSRDTKVDVSRDFDRAVLDRSQPAYIDGVEVIYHLPFRGDKELLECRPSSFTFNPPRAVISRGELLFPYDRPGRDIAGTKQSFAEDLSSLKQWLPWVNQQVAAYNSTVESAVRQRVAQRRQELEKSNEDLNSLGFKVRAEQQASRPSTNRLPREEATKRRAAVRQKVRRTYDVALSFAGEDREYVEQVAEQLRDLGVTVFYDRFEEVALWGSDLTEHLGQVYGKDSRFVVLFLSRAYAAKAWPRHEKQFALGRQLTTGAQRILPVRFDDTEIPGLPTTVGYLDLRVLSPEKLVELIRQKLDQSEA
jgi:hypothetical protein